MSLYLKYRPNDFENMIGQDPIRKTLLNSLSTWNISHAYLFSGPRWTWKTTCARLIAKALNCLNLKNDWSPCQVCQSCISINDWSFVDLVEIDAASNTWVDNVRDLQSKIWFSPSNWKKKVYVLDEVHMLSKWAFNALLKTLEEPPEFVHFILVTTEFHKVLDTIISRCINLNFRNISEVDISLRLEHICNLEWFEYEKWALELIAHQANWWMRDAISILDKLRSEWKLNVDEVSKNLWLTTNLVVEDLIDNIFKWNKDKCLNLINDLANKWYDLSTFQLEILESLRTRLHDKKDNKEIKTLLKVISHFVKAAENLRYSIIPQLPLEMACIESILSIWAWIEIGKESKTKSENDNIEIETKKGEIKIEQIHKKERPSIIELPNLTIENVKKLKKDIESKLKDPEIKIAFRNSEIKDLNNDQLIIETQCNRDSLDINSDKWSRDIFNAFHDVFWDTKTRFIARNKSEEIIKEIGESKKQNSKTLNEMADWLFDF